MTQATPNKILLVDDNPFFLTLLVEGFKTAGMECVIADSAFDAIERLKTFTPDIILSDYEMPGMNGIEFRKHLMQDRLLRDIPFAFLSSLRDKDVALEGLDLQAIDFIIKDTPFDIIISKLNSILLNVQKQRELSTLEVQAAAKSLNIKTIPIKSPTVNGFDIDFWHRPFQEIPGGDFIDFIPVNSRYTFVVLGDIMGKKWQAWYFTFGYLSYVRSAVRFAALDNDFSTSSILRKVNSIICLDDVLKDILSSLSLLLIDTENHSVLYSGAGDLPLLHYSAASGKLRSIASEGLLLGLFPDGGYNEQQIILENNDQLFIFTDGMIDFATPSGKKSDYNLFADKISDLLKTDTEFKQLKEKLFAESIGTQVDDCSIINVLKR
ncbi:fused response regulator/phosphatase [Mucilaginibacter limnophilus]|uniref:Fused response regulator/phosphatase n=1 Tax=Mucilaginibacter limnophilus TaxID=1932778 RepID=A0A3S2Y3K4_9SPHI|nr:fused response regulator/phosphatase [Mucilaginibacter limnophilus]RVU02715.1 fused response regulator/phosphatase [Mucilaginibacter limnophilus]